MATPSDKESITVFKDTIKKHFSLNRFPKRFQAPALLSVLFLLTALPFTLALVSQRQDLRQHAATGDVVHTLDFFLPKDTSMRLNSNRYRVTTDNKVYIDFGNDFQIYKWDSQFIYFLEDTRHNTFSPGTWMKMDMTVGQPLPVQGTQFIFEKDTCDPSTTATPNPQPFNYTLTLTTHELHGNFGGSLTDVEYIVLKYDYVSRFELFYYAKGFGFFHWEKHNPDGTMFQNGPMFNALLPFDGMKDCTFACTPALQTCTELPRGNLTPGAPTATITGAPAATDTPTGVLSPTGTPSLTPTSALSPTPTIAVAPTGTPSSVATVFALKFSLQGIGKSGDSLNSTGQGTLIPIHQKLPVTITLFDTAGNQLLTKTDDVLYNPLNTDYEGQINIGTTTGDGIYIVQLSVPEYVPQRLKTPLQVTSGTVMTIPPLSLVAGDANNDGKIDLLDYNMMLDCFSEDQPPKACSDPAKKAAADINDDGKVDGFDLNLFIREFLAQSQ